MAARRSSPGERALHFSSVLQRGAAEEYRRHEKHTSLSAYGKGRVREGLVYGAGWATEKLVKITSLLESVSTLATPARPCENVESSTVPT